MSVPGYKLAVNKSGTPTASTGNAFSTNSTVANSYRMTSTARRVWDRSVAPIFHSSGSTISSTNIAAIDYLFGTVRFASTWPGPIAADLTYLPMTAVVGANSFTLGFNRELLDDTDFNSTDQDDGWRSRNVGLFDATLSLETWTALNNTFFDKMTKSSIDDTVVVEIQHDDITPRMSRGFFRISQDDFSGGVADLEQEMIELAIDGSSIAAFSYSTAG